MSAREKPPRPIPFAEAQAQLVADVRPLGVETVTLDAASGRFLAEDLVARRTQPAANLSAMDGYAVREDDLAGPWRVVGESAAGHPYPGPLSSGEAIRISTGALMPVDGGAVLLQENAERDGDELRLMSNETPDARHIRRKGFDFGCGDVLLRQGSRLGPAQIALAISAGMHSACCRKLPQICILDSGDELSSDPQNCEPHQIPASNGPMLAALVAPLASSVRRIGPVADSLEALSRALAIAEGYDVLVTTGGASVGDHDLLRPALDAWGAEVTFWRVAMKPGKPLMIARRGEQWIVGLPGNPVSSFVGAHMFLTPLLRALAGSSDPVAEPVSLPLASGMPATGSRTEFIRARLGPGGIAPIEQQDSSALRSLSRAQALIMRPAHASECKAGEMVPVYLLENGPAA